jgi:effector-binding domain-containing protein
LVERGKKRVAIGIITRDAFVLRSSAEAFGMQYEVRLEQFGGVPTAVVRRRASSHELSRVVPDACGLVWKVIRARQVKGAGRHVALYLDDQINLEVGVELDAPFAGDGEVIGSALPAGTVASAVHFGPYGQLHAAHRAIRDWCVKQGYSLAGPCWEIYGHWDDAWNRDPSRIRTDVCYLVKTVAQP